MCMFSVFVHHKLKHLWDCHTINSWKKLIIIYCILIKQSFTLYFFRNGWSELVYPINWHSHYTFQKMMKWRLVRLVLFSEVLRRSQCRWSIKSSSSWVCFSWLRMCHGTVSLQKSYFKVSRGRGQNRLSESIVECLSRPPVQLGSRWSGGIAPATALRQPRASLNRSGS